MHHAVARSKNHAPLDWLADRHPKPDVKRAIARLAVLGRLDQKGSRYTLPANEAGQG